MKNQKRRHSFDGRLHLRESEEDLALFNDLRNREINSSLFHKDDDLDKPPFPKLGVSISSQGKSNEFLDVDAQKNDFDWLLTPPDTPPFPSFDGKVSPVYLADKIQPASRPYFISTSSIFMESYKANGSITSPSHSSSHSSCQSRRQSSFPNSPSIPFSHSAKQTHRLSMPPSKPSIHTRPSTPISPKMNYGKRQEKRGSSTSPKLRTWQLNLPELSLETPPNLRTSLPDRAVSHSRRRSMSPTASRSVNLSRNCNHHGFISHDKDHSSSSRDDDMGPSQSVMRISVPLNSRKSHVSINNTCSSSSLRKQLVRAPRANFQSRCIPDSGLHQVDCKTPQYTFRSPTRFDVDVGGSNNEFHPDIVRTTSNNTFLEKVSDAAPITENNGHMIHDLVVNWTKEPDFQEEMCAFDSTGEHCSEKYRRLQEIQSCKSYQSNELNLLAISEPSCLARDQSKANGGQNSVTCSKCGNDFLISESLDYDIDACQKCVMKARLSYPRVTEAKVVAKECNDILPELHENVNKCVVNQTENDLQEELRKKKCKQHEEDRFLRHTVVSGHLQSLSINSTTRIHGSIGGEMFLPIKRTSITKCSASQEITAPLKIHSHSTASREISQITMSNIREEINSVSKSVDLQYDADAKTQDSICSFSEKAKNIPKFLTCIKRQKENNLVIIDEVKENDISQAIIDQGKDTTSGSSGSGADCSSLLRKIALEDDSCSEIDAFTSVISSSKILERNNNTSSDVIEDIILENGKELWKWENFQNSSGIVPTLQRPLNQRELETDSLSSTMKFNESGHIHSTHDSNIIIEGPEGCKTRSLTLEEATDTILFCSSIIHNLAYEAVSIGNERESKTTPLDILHSSTTMPEKSSASRKDSCHRSSTRRIFKLKKIKQRQLDSEANVKPVLTMIKHKVKETTEIHDLAASNKIHRSDPSKLEYKCSCVIM